MKLTYSVGSYYWWSQFIQDTLHVDYYQKASTDYSTDHSLDYNPLSTQYISPSARKALQLVDRIQCRCADYTEGASDILLVMNVMDC